MRRLSLIAIQMLRNAKSNFLRCIGYVTSTKDRIKLDSLPPLALALQQNCLNYLTSCLTAVKSLVIRYYETVYERSRENIFWSINNSGEVVSKLKSRGFSATSLSIYDFFTLYTP